METAANNRVRKIVIAGGSGFLGRGLIKYLEHIETEIVVLTRSDSRTERNVRFIQWDGKNTGPWTAELDGACALINLVGRTVDCQKTARNKAVILSSRVDSVNALVAAVLACKVPPPVWVQAATAHIYGDTRDECLDESSSIGTGFAPDVGVAWEAALDQVPDSVRKVVLRISFVLGRNGGPLKILARLARYGLGGTVGNGKQYISWIHELDLYCIIERAFTDSSMRGVYVITAPNPVTNQQFMRQLREAVNRPWSPPAPALVVRFGSWILRTDPELALLGRRCIPTRLLNEGFSFSYPQLNNALVDLLK